MSIKHSLLSVLLLFLGYLANAQKKPFSKTVTIGVTTPVLDNGIGPQLGLNPAYRLSPVFSLEEQMSYDSPQNIVLKFGYRF